MDRVLRFAVWGLVVLNVGYGLLLAVENAGSSKSREEWRQKEPEKLALLSADQFNEKRADSKLGSLACVALSVADETGRDQALSALGAGASVSPKAFKAEGQAWWIQWGGSITEQEAAEKIAQWGALGPSGPRPWGGRKGWGLRWGPMGSEQEAAAGVKILSAKGVNGPALAREPRKGYEVRFGPWLEKELKDIDRLGASWGAGKARACDKKENEEWGKFK